MANHSLPVRGKPHIKFKPVAALLQTKIERSQSIFRNMARSPSPTVPKKKRSSHLAFAFLGVLGVSAVKKQVLSPNQNPG